MNKSQNFIYLFDKYTSFPFMTFETVNKVK